MAETITLAVNSIEQVAVDMAGNILIAMEQKEWSSITRKEYLQTVAECVAVLRGSSPSASKP
jgi:hypothetical protein